MSEIFELPRWEQNYTPTKAEWDALFALIETGLNGAVFGADDYDSATNYRRMDLVYSDTSYWLALADSLNVEPGSDITKWRSLGGGAPDNASTTVKGITKLSTAPLDAAQPIAVSDTDPRVAPTGVTPGSYTFAGITVDAQGRITAAGNGTVPAAGSTQPGTMSTADYNKLAAATAAASALTLAMRDASARLKVADPADDGDAANKGWVAAQLGALEIEGAPNASESVKGIVKLTTPPADEAEPLAVSDTDPRLLPVVGVGIDATDPGLVPAAGVTPHSPPYVLTENGVFEAPTTGSDGDQAANAVKAGPTSGAADEPTYRALVAADIPSIDASKTNSGQFAMARIASGTPGVNKWVHSDGTVKDLPSALGAAGLALANIFTAVNTFLLGILLPNGQTIKSRNAADSADLILLHADSDDVLQLGNQGMGVGLPVKIWNLLFAHRTDAATNTATVMSKTRHDTSGTPAAGFGIAETYEGQSTTTPGQDMGGREITWTTATHASRTSKWAWWAVLSGVKTYFMEAGPGGVNLLGAPTAPTASAGNNSTQIATTAYADAAVALAVTGLLEFKGSTDCSANPNYPAALKGDAYVVSVAGKIGGASGASVDVGDVYVASADNAGGTQASVGASWFVLEHNLINGAALPAGGTEGQVLAKASADDFDAEWVDQSGGLTAETAALLDKEEESYPFQEGTGTTLANAKNGKFADVETNGGAFGWGTLGSLTAIDLAGGAWVRAPRAVNGIIAQRQFSVSCLFSTPDVDAIEYQVLFCSNISAYIYLLVNADGTIGFRLETGYNYDSAPGVISDNTVYHAVLTWDGDTGRLYLDGTQVATGTGPMSSISVDQNFNLGNYRDGALSANFWTGQIAAFRVWSRALKASEVAALVADPLAGL